MSRRSRGGRGRRPGGDGGRRERPPETAVVDPAAATPRAADEAARAGGDANTAPALTTVGALPHDGADGPAVPDERGAGPQETRAGCTAPQLRRFIKSRAYVPLHELRRRFAIDGAEDDVHPIDLEGRRVFVGLPAPEARMLGELLRGGDVGYELSLDPRTPIVVGVYPMRPVARI